MQSSLVEIVERQNTIISVQACVINDLFQLLSQHISTEELSALPAIDEIGQVAEIKQELNNLRMIVD